MVAQGSFAPDFTSVDGAGQPISLAAFRGKKIALYFYPKDDTPGCTLEACNLRDHFEQLEGKAITVLGVSKDTVDSHRDFSEKYDLPFRLVADPEGKIGAAYGVSTDKNHRRVTFLIDEQGLLTAVIDPVNVHDHAAEILRGFGLG